MWSIVLIMSIVFVMSTPGFLCKQRGQRMRNGTIHSEIINSKWYQHPLDG